MRRFDQKGEKLRGKSLDGKVGWVGLGFMAYQLL